MPVYLEFDKIRLINGDDHNLRTSIIESLRIMIIAVLLVIFVFNLTCIYLGIIINKTILQPKFLISALRKQQAYAQIRQLMFRLVNSSLPNGQESIPYLNQAISESWLEKEINFLLKGFYAFARGEISNTPTISFSKLKSQVVDVLDDNRSLDERTRQVQFWFDPLPDEVHLEDFMSIDFIWAVRLVTGVLKRLPWIMCCSALFIILLMYLAIFNWRQLVLWIATGGIAAGALLIMIGQMMRWATQHMSVVMDIMDRLISYDIPETSVYFFATSLTNGIINPMNILGIISIFISSILLYFIPIEERPITLIK